MSATLRCMAMGTQRRTELLRGVLDLCLLAVIDEGPAYGYGMTKRLRDRGLAIVGEGSIYPFLGRLERESGRDRREWRDKRERQQKKKPSFEAGRFLFCWACPNGELPVMPSMRCSLLSTSRWRHE